MQSGTFLDVARWIVLLLLLILFARYLWTILRVRRNPER
jgi:hypothetical protein